jgi:hypothetical protein
MTLRDAAAQPPSAQRQRATAPARNVPAAQPGDDFNVEVIRGLNRSLTKYGRNEDGSWGMPTRNVDYEKLPGMGERLIYDSADPNYNEALQYGRDQQHDITLKELENKGKLDEQALRNKGMQQRAATTGKKDDAATKLATEISKSLYDDDGANPVDYRTAALELLRLRKMDEEEALRLMASTRQDQLEKIKDLWIDMGIYEKEDFE